MKKYLQLQCFGIEMPELVILSVNEEICVLKKHCFFEASHISSIQI